MKVLPRAPPWLMGLALWLVASPAAAWIETRVVSDDVIVEVERSGMATIDHAITMQVKGGPLRSFDMPVREIDAAPLEGSAVAAQSDGSAGLPVSLHLSTRPDGALRVNVDSPRGISRGMFLFHVRYRKNLLTGGNVRRDGAMLRIGWTGPAWQEGLDNAKCTFVLPAAPTEPRPPGLGAKGEGDDEELDESIAAFLSQVRRSATHDEVELIRPHVARTEAARWSVRVDPRALASTDDPRLRPAAPPSPRPVLAPERRAAFAGAAGILLVGFSMLAFAKARQVKEHTHGVAEPRPLWPIGTTLRILLAGPTLLAGVALQLGNDDPWWGTLVVLLAMTLVWYLPPLVRRRPRGRGRWLPLADSEAFGKPAPSKGAWLDASTRKGLALFTFSMACCAGLAYAVSRVSTYDAYLTMFDSAVLFPLFGTGRRRELPSHPVFGPGPTLERIAARLRRSRGVRAIAWARLPEGSDRFDELRLLCAPKLPLRGFIGIEVGLVGVGGMGGFIHLPEVLVRVVDGSPCHDAYLELVRGSRWIRGRKADERVVALRPRLPTVLMTSALASRLLRQAFETAAPTTAPPSHPQTRRIQGRPTPGPVANRNGPRTAGAASRPHTPRGWRGAHVE